MSKKKKIVLLSTLTALLVVTAVCNFIFTGNITANNTATTTINADYFCQRRTERASDRNETILQLDEIISNAQTTASEKSEAVKLKQTLAKNSECELLLESLIKSYGFDDVIVLIGVDSENVNVIVKDEELSEEESVAIYTIINEELSKSPEKVKIISIS